MRGKRREVERITLSMPRKEFIVGVLLNLSIISLLIADYFACNLHSLEPFKFSLICCAVCFVLGIIVRVILKNDKTIISVS